MMMSASIITYWPIRVNAILSEFGDRATIWTADQYPHWASPVDLLSYSRTSPSQSGADSKYAHDFYRRESAKTALRFNKHVSRHESEWDKSGYHFSYASRPILCDLIETAKKTKQPIITWDLSRLTRNLNLLRDLLRYRVHFITVKPLTIHPDLLHGERIKGCQDVKELHDSIFTSVLSNLF